MKIDDTNNIYKTFTYDDQFTSVIELSTGKLITWVNFKLYYLTKHVNLVNYKGTDRL